MNLLQRFFSLAIISIVALTGIQLFSPETLKPVHDVVLPYVARTPFSRFLSNTKPLFPRSEIPIIISSTTHWSHYEKIAAVALELAQLGYPITFIVGRLFEDHVVNLHPNIKFVPALGPDNMMSPEDLKTWISIPAGLEQEIFAMTKVFVDTMPDQHESLQIQLRAHKQKYGDSKPIIAMFDQTVGGHFTTHFGVPGIKPDYNIGISLAPLTLDSNDTYPFRSGKVPHNGPDAREIHWAAYQEYYEHPMTKRVSEAWWTKLRELGATRKTPYPHLIHAMNAEPDRLLTLGVPQFEFPRSDIRNDIKYFGAFKKVGKHGAGETKFPSWWGDIETAKKEGKKIVAVSQGTVAPDLQDIVLPTIEALKDRDDVLVIASFVVMEPEDVPNLVVPENTRVAKFVPYDKLLPLVDLLVSNGGYGAVQHALRVGIPMVVSGLTQDKATTNTLVQWSGVGINLGVQQPGAERIGAAAKKVLEDSSYKAKAMSLSKAYENYDVAEVFDATVQEVMQEWTEKRDWKGEL